MKTILLTLLAAIGFAFWVYLIKAIANIGNKRYGNRTFFQAAKISFKEMLFIFFLCLYFTVPAGLALGFAILKIQFMDSFIK